MIKVYIRSLLDEKGKLLGNFNPSEIDSIVELAKKYGSSIDDGESMIEGKYFDSQFVISEEDRHFEIIIEQA